MKTKNVTVSALLWISIYLLMVLAPLMILNMGEVPPGSGFWWDLSMALGFAGMAMMAVQFLLTARFKRASAPFGIDIIYYFHRYLSIVAFVFIFLHFLILRIDSVEALGATNPFEAPWYMTAGRVSLLLFILLILSSLFRKQLKLKYELWRILHIFGAVLAFLLALAHIEGVGYYIADPQKHWLWTAYTLSFVLLIVYIRLIKPWSMKKHPYKVVEVKKEITKVYTLTLKPLGHEGMQFKAGQFAWLSLRNSPYHIKEHPFSFSSSPCSQKLEFTIKELGDFTSTIKDAQIDDLVYLDGPYGTFSVDNYQDAAGFVFIAAGVGAAPIMSMLRSLVAKEDKREITFLDINNTWDDIIFKEELQEMKKKLNLNLIHLLTKEKDDTKEVERGRITKELFQKILPKNFKEVEYFMCGPKPVSDAAQKELYAMKVPLSKVHFELFDMV